jgi:hypothetical protein
MNRLRRLVRPTVLTLLASTAACSLGASSAHAAGPHRTLLAYSSSAGTTVGAASAGLMADIDADGAPDMLVGDDAGFVDIEPFGEATQQVLVTETPSQLAAGDFDGDGDTDVAVAFSSSNDVVVLLRGADGTYVASATSPEATGSTSTQSMVAADVDGDGVSDLVVATGGDASAHVLLGGASGDLTAGAVVSSGGALLVARAADLDGDSDPDLVLRRGADVVAAINDGTGAFTTGAPVALSTSQYPTLDVGDIDGDGDVDVVVGQPLATDLDILENDGTGALTLDTIDTLGWTYTPHAAGFADANGDGHVDLFSVADDGAGAGALRMASGTTTPGSYDVEDTEPLAAAIPTDIAVLSLAGTTYVATFTAGDPLQVFHVAAPPTATPTPTSFARSQPVATVSPIQTLTVANTGDLPMTVTDVSITGADVDDFWLVGESCTAGVVAAGGSCTVRFRFLPSTVGARAAAIEVTSDDPQSPTISVPISGTGTELATQAGPAGPVGAAGAAGATGLVGATGATGVRGVPGKTAFVTCIVSSTRRGPVVSCSVVYKGAPAARVSATLSRRTRVTRRWSATRVTLRRGHGAFRLRPGRRAPAGRYRMQITVVDPRDGSTVRLARTIRLTR